MEKKPTKKPKKKKSKKQRGKVDQWLTENGLLLIGAWARDGATDETISKKMGIVRSTLNEWKKKYPDLAEVLRKNKEIVDIEVENALLKRATGFIYTEQVPMKLKTEFWTEAGKCSEEKAEIVEVVKFIPPDHKAAQYWLNNRRPENWKANREDSAEGEGEVEVLIPEADREQFE